MTTTAARRRRDRPHRRAVRSHPPEQARQRAVLRHGEGQVGRRQQIRLQRREHRQDRRDDHQPEARRPQIVLRGRRDERVGLPGAEGGDRVAGGHADRGDEEQQRQVDEQGDGERQQHGARNRAAGVADLAGDGGDEVEPLQGDERVPHRLEDAERAVGEEGGEGRQQARRRNPRDDRQAAGDENGEGDDLPDRRPSAASGAPAHQARRIEERRPDRENRHGDSPAQPVRRGSPDAAPQHLDDDDPVRGEAQGVQHAGDDGCEPDDPADRERGLHRQHLLGEGVRSAGFGKGGGHLGEAQGREDGDAAVDREGDHRRRAGRGERHAGQRQDAASDDGADADRRGAHQPDGTGGRGGSHLHRLAHHPARSYSPPPTRTATGEVRRTSARRRPPRPSPS